MEVLCGDNLFIFTGEGRNEIYNRELTSRFFIRHGVIRFVHPEIPSMAHYVLGDDGDMLFSCAKTNFTIN